MDSADAAAGKRRTQAWMGPASQPPAPTGSLRWVPNPEPAPAWVPASTPAGAGVRAPGSLIGGRYRLVRALGEGTLTETWEATHVELERRVAIKFLRRTEAGVFERMLAEARAIAQIRHPHVLGYSDFGRSDQSGQGEPFFVMELLAGQTVAQLLARRRVIPWVRAVAIVQQIGEALGAAHQHGVVHRDLRPGNVFLLDLGQAGDFVKVVDFGLARASVLGGTPSYMSPEQCRGEPLDPRSDVYALGCLLVATITGDPPFVGDPQRVIRKQLEEAPKSLRERAPRQFIPDELETIVARCLAKHPAQRFADTRELADALARLAQFGAATSIVGAPLGDASASGSRPMGYAGRPPPKSPRELTDSYKPVNQAIADEEPNRPSSGKLAQSGSRVSAGTIVAATLAGVLAVTGVGVGMYLLIDRLIGEVEPDTRVRVAPEASERAVQPVESTPALSPAAASAPVPAQVEAAAVVVEQAEPTPASALGSAVKPAAVKPAKKSPSKEPPESAPPPAAKPHKPSAAPESKAKSELAHDELRDPWG